MRFFIEQIALCPPNTVLAKALLSELGLNEWAEDIVVAKGAVFGSPAENVARLSFNYQATRPDGKPLELEALSYRRGDNWMSNRDPAVSHLGMHCSDAELTKWRAKFTALGIGVAQEVFTQSHSNPEIAGKRWYQYVIFDTRDVLGVDLKFIVRRDAPGAL